MITVMMVLCALSSVSASDTTGIRIGKNVFYVQVAGRGIQRSVNYERVFRQGKKLSYCYGLGVSVFTHNTSFPFSVNAFTTAPRHHLEFSFGIIPYIEKHVSPLTKETTDTDKQLFLKPAIGYRFQKAGAGFFLKTGIGPQIFIDPPSSNVWNFKPKLISPSAHLAIGFCF